MRGFLAIARREIAERRAVLSAAAFAGLVPLAIPVARGLTGAGASEVRSWVALIVSAAFGLGLMVAFGLSTLAPPIASRRIAFDFGRPVSAFAIWGGRLAAACVLAIVSALIVWVPAGIVGAAVPWRDLFPSTSLPPLWPLILLAGLCAIFAACHAMSVIFRSRSTWIVADAALLVATWLGISAALSNLPSFLAHEPRVLAMRAFALLLLTGVLVAGYASVAFGRTDINAAHRALSLLLWIAVGAALLAVNAYALWVMAASPADLKKGFWASPAPAGSWTIIEGRARRAHATFLYDTASGRFRRARVVDWNRPAFSADGRRAVWVEGRDGGGPFEVMELALDDPKSNPARTRVFLPSYPALLVLSHDGSRLATVENGVLSIHDLTRGKTLASARVAERSGEVTGFFLGDDRFRVYRQTDTERKTRRLDVLELDAASKTLAKKGGGSEFSDGWLLLAANATGDRLLVIQTRSRQTWLIDGRTGAVLQKLAGEASEARRSAGFLSDGRIVVAERSPQAARLRIYLPSGDEEESIPLPSARPIVLGGEVAAGRLVLGVGEERDGWSNLVDVDSRVVGTMADRLRPAARLASFWQFHDGPEVGSDATKLFYAPDRSLIHLDPTTGERRVILGKDLRP